MLTHHLTASSTLLLLALGACGCDPSAEEDTKCTKVESTTSILIPEDPSNSSDAHIGGRCLDSSADVDISGRADCVVIAAHRGAPTCIESEGLVAVSAEHQGAVDRLRETDEAKAGGWDTFCEMVQLDPASESSQACRTDDLYNFVDEMGNRANGFCYLDAAASPPVGDPRLLETCPDGKRRAIRFSDSIATHIGPEAKSVTIVCSSEVCPER